MRDQYAANRSNRALLRAQRAASGSKRSPSPTIASTPCSRDAKTPVPARIAAPRHPASSPFARITGPVWPYASALARSASVCRSQSTCRMPTTRYWTCPEARSRPPAQKLISARLSQHMAVMHQIKSLATTYSPTLKGQYHRRDRAYLPCSGWERVVPLRHSHRAILTRNRKGDVTQTARCQRKP